ncbi:MAG: hypothetical protein AB7T10_00715 [bacterium]
MACSILDPLSEDGWTYLKQENFSKAHAKFLQDFSSFPDSLDIVGGLSYTFFAFGERDSAKYYLDLSREIETDNNISLFVSTMYFRDEPESASGRYRTFVSKYSSFPLYAVRDVVKSNTIHKLGLSIEIQRDSFDYAYSILKRITSIDDSLDMNSDEDRFLIIEYINSLEE